MSTVTIQLQARDQRFLRAAGDVVKNYRLTAVTSDTETDIAYTVKRRASDYTVTIADDWSHPPRCTCPDARYHGRERNGGYCKHIIAVMLIDETVRYQLLELLL